jgi:HAD superfamily hydrolase (TIGR01509 family)
MIGSMPRLAAVVFDFDGVVLDSETPEYESHRRIYEQSGATLTVDEWCDAVGVWTDAHEDRRFATLCERSARAPSRAVYYAERHRIFESLVPAEPMHGIRDLLHALERADVRRAIASTAPADWVLPAADRIDVRSLFEVVVTGDVVARRKPAPDVYLEAARRLGVAPIDAVAIEDSAPGVTAARAAGMAVVAIPHWLTKRHDLSAADLIVADAGELTVERLQRLIAEC